MSLNVKGQNDQVQGHFFPARFAQTSELVSNTSSDHQQSQIQDQSQVNM